MSTESTTSSSDKNRREIPDHVIRELREAGASNLFIEVIQTPAAEVGVERNSAREEVLKYIEWAEGNKTTVREYLSYGGGFFQNLFRGRTGGADQNNQRILEHVRGGETTGVIDL